MSEYRIDACGSLRGVSTTPQGGLESPAYLTRAGVFEYRNADGSKRMELRHPDQVFHADSLATLRGAPLTVGHPGIVTTENYQEHAVGHVSDDVRADGQFISSRVRVQDSTALLRVQRKDLRELSCGYRCDIDNTPGVFEGQPYDCAQKNIRYNHVALVPVGRAGTDVRLRMDGQDVEVGVGVPTQAVSHTSGMTEAEEKQLRADAAEATRLKAENERLSGENSTLKATAETLRADASEERFDARVNERLALHAKAKAILGADADLAGLSDRAVMEKSLAKYNKTFRADEKSSIDFVRGAFEAACASTSEVSDAEAKLRADAANAKTAPADREDSISKAHDGNIQRSLNAWKSPLSITR